MPAELTKTSFNLMPRRLLLRACTWTGWTSCLRAATCCTAITSIHNAMLGTAPGRAVNAPVWLKQEWHSTRPLAQQQRAPLGGNYEYVSHPVGNTLCLCHWLSLLQRVYRGQSVGAGRPPDNSSAHL